MKRITSLTLASLSLGLAPSASAQDGDFLSKIKFSGALRARYEFRETDPFDASHALTVRARIGVTLGDFNGFSAFVEGEGTQGIIEDFRSNPGGAPVTSPYVAGNSVIADPNNAELNQAYLQYKKDGLLVKVGRQRIIRNKAAFIGNVGWRQNEQTFDAIQLGYKNEDLSVSYAYFDRVQRIFGDEPSSLSPLHAFTGEFHIFDFNTTTDFGKLGGYAYLLDVENNAAVGESNTFGLFAESKGFYAEFAYQDGTSTVAGGDYSALYGHLKYTADAAGGKGTIGVEYLGDDFKTPLATVHAYNGYADFFVLQRIGLNNGGGAYNGLTNVYLNYTKKGLPGGLVFKGFLHYFADAQLDEVYGYEADAVLVKKFNKDLTGVLKLAYFVGDDDFGDVQQASVQLDYKF